MTNGWAKSSAPGSPITPSRCPAGQPDRLEPDFFLSEWFHSSRAVKGGRNYGNFINQEYDKIVDAQRREMDVKKRVELVYKAQKIIAKENPFFGIMHHDYVQVYNKDRVEGVIPVMGNGIGFAYLPWTFYKAKPKTNIREVRVANLNDIHTLNPFATPEVENEGWLRMMYDTILKRDADLNIIPWMAESWKVVDYTTVDIVLRDGMKFHDGKPVTVEDVKFTFDYIIKWKFPALTRVSEADQERRCDGGTKSPLQPCRALCTLYRQYLGSCPHCSQTYLGENSAIGRGS